MPYPAHAACLVCGGHQPAPLLSLYEEGVDHGGPGHSFTYAYGVLSACLKCGHGQLEVFSHDCFQHYEDEDHDMWWWYALDMNDVLLLRAALRGCPDPRDAKCACPLHGSLRESARRLWGGVRHAVAPGPSPRYAWARVEERAGLPVLAVVPGS